MKKIVEFKNVSKKYYVGDTIISAIDNISFSIDEGEFVVILGASGAGKSTVLNLLGGMDKVSSGQIIIDNQDITNYKDSELTKYRGIDIGFVFQFYNLIPSLTVYENVSLVNEVANNTINPNEVLELVGLSHRTKLFPTQISGGEQQRVSIARAVCKNPKLLLCDEPTGALDSETGIKVLTLLQNMNKKYKKTVIIVTHNSSIAQIADRVIRFCDGKIISDDSIKNPKSIKEVNW